MTQKPSHVNLGNSVFNNRVTQKRQTLPGLCFYIFFLGYLEAEFV